MSEDDLNSVETIKTLRPLFDNYFLETWKTKVVTIEHRLEQDRFLETVLRTEVIQILMEFFKKKGVRGFNGNKSSKMKKLNQKSLLKYLWFTKYARERGGARVSSGFKHVFCHEIVRKV